MTQTAHHRPTLVLGGTGKIGRRPVERRTRRRVPVQIGSRSAGSPFDCDQPSAWGPVYQDVGGAHTYLPDRVVSNPSDAIAGVVEPALGAGIRRLVRLSERGEGKAGACEKVLMSAGADGRDAEVAHGIKRVRGRPEWDLADCVRATAAAGVWAPADKPIPGGSR
jgi:uncharacterized protein YbjT (DUF2867 family)